MMGTQYPPVIASDERRDRLNERAYKWGEEGYYNWKFTVNHELLIWQSDHSIKPDNWNPIRASYRGSTLIPFIAPPIN